METSQRISTTFLDVSRALTILQLQQVNPKWTAQLSLVAPTCRSPARYLYRHQIRMTLLSCLRRRLLTKRYTVVDLRSLTQPAFHGQLGRTLSTVGRIRETGTNSRNSTPKLQAHCLLIRLLSLYPVVGTTTTDFKRSRLAGLTSATHSTRIQRFREQVLMASAGSKQQRQRQYPPATQTILCLQVSSTVLLQRQPSRGSC